MAGSYFNQLAALHGIPTRAIARGTDPDVAIAERVRQHLGDALCTQQPTRFALDELSPDDLVISFDLGEPELGARPDRSWDALPALSDDFEGGRAAIVARVEKLVAELKAQAVRVDGS